jgi:hypothetical protein
MFAFIRNIRFGLIGLSGLAIMAVLVIIPNMVETLGASEIMVIQSPMGTLSVYTEPGPYWQGFGTVTKYPRQAQYSFCSVERVAGQPEQPCEGATTMAKRLRFNDGGHANLNGSVNWEMPLDKESIINIHKKFGSAAGVESRAVGKMLDAAVYLAGPLMSSTESSGARRGQLVQYINDQAESGVYVTSVKNIIEKDAGGNDVTSTITEIQHNANGQPLRQQGSILSAFNIKLLPLSISELKYDDVVEKQIAQRQNATTAVQISRANATKAEQDAITVEAEGKATAARTKWTQEAINAKEIAEAEKAVKVAELGAAEAEQYKKEQILRGEGEAARKRAVMLADGALDKKLEAYKVVQGYWANAFKDFHGTMVPQVQMGGAANGGSSAMGAQQLMEILSVKAARDLSLDLTNAGKGATAQ